MLIKTNYIIKKIKKRNKKKHVQLACIVVSTKPKLAMYTLQSLHGYLFGTHSYIFSVKLFNDFSPLIYSEIWFQILGPK